MVAAHARAVDRKADETEAVIVEGRRERSTVVLDEPVLTGSRLGIDAFDLPASVSVISHELIQLRGARTAVEAIESAVGMTEWHLGRLDSELRDARLCGQ